AGPCMRPLKAWRTWGRAGGSIARSSRLGGLGRALPAGPAAVAIAAATAAAAPAATAFLRLDGALLGGHRVVLHDLALEDPHFDADNAIGGLGEAVAEIDVGAQRVQRHASLAIPFHPRDLRAPQTPRAV